MHHALLPDMLRYDRHLLSCLNVFALLAFSACYPKYSPPARLGTYGIPEMQTAGSAAVQIGAGAPRYIEPRLTLALNELVAVDASFYILLNRYTLKYDDPTFMGSMGLHVRWIQHSERGWRGSLVLGPAVGRGGERRFDADEPPPAPHT